MFAFAKLAKSALRILLVGTVLLPAEAILLTPQKADAYVAVRRGAYGRTTAVARGPYGRTAVVHRGPYGSYGRYGRPAAVGEYRYGPTAAGVARRTARRTTRRYLYGLPSGYRTVYVGGSPYYYTGGTYYRRVYVNGRRAYVVANPY